MAVHPFDPLSLEEIEVARQVILDRNDGKLIDFREIYLREPAKDLMKPFLELEHAGKLRHNIPRPPRLAKVQFDVVGPNKKFEFHESSVDVQKKEQVSHEVIDDAHHANLTVFEFRALIDACERSPLYKAEVAKFKLPKGFDIVIEPWPYGGPDQDEENRRYFQGLCFAQNQASGNPDSNFYAYPLPIIPVMDARKREIVRVDRLATGGKQDGLRDQTRAERVIDHCRPAEYAPEFLQDRLRKDLKPLNIVQPEGVSFKVAGHLVEWQKWRFRVGFNPREGATLHDITYDGRPVLYRLSMSEMTVPYADPRPPFPRKQAFDFGDGGLGHCANNLTLGCDCLGQIAYFSTALLTHDGKGEVSPNVICLHEQDNGLSWKHTNWRTDRAVSARNRELVVQFIITLANYEYVFNYKFNVAAAISVEARATGIVSVVSIDANKTSNYGTVVSPGALAQNHQHIFCLRMDPAVDGHSNTVVVEESHPASIHDDTNPAGNFYNITRSPVKQSTYLDAAPHHNRVIKITNPSKANPISGKPVSYKFVPPPTQLLLAHPDSVQAKRAQFAQHHVWVTRYRDNELYAGGRFTLQSQQEVGGVTDAAARKDNVENEDVVVWSVFGLTHNPRVEDWPVMPYESLEVKLVPADFFTENPAIDVPGGRNKASRLVNGVNGVANGVGSLQINGCH